MSETQYKDYYNLPRYSLGVMSNEIWHRDPKMLGIHLARYKFVAKMLSGKRHVAEIGCGDGWYSEIVKREVDWLTIYDFDRDLIFQTQKGEGRCIIFHDICNDSIEHTKKFNAIYSLDVLEHIDPDKEDSTLTNICNSLDKHGVFIVGMPSLESQKYASKASKIGHVNCKSGADLSALLRKYFHNVFMFGMNDETIHTGFFPMCHYLLGVCCGVR